jgi:hypothetical protein
MGEFLSQPIIAKHSENKENDSVKIKINKVKVWYVIYARLEKAYGRCTYYRD